MIRLTKKVLYKSSIISPNFPLCHKMMLHSLSIADGGIVLLIGTKYFCPLLPSDAGNQDRVVIQELIKFVAQSQQIQSSSQREFKGR